MIEVLSLISVSMILGFSFGLGFFIAAKLEELAGRKFGGYMRTRWPWSRKAAIQRRLG